MSRTVTAMFDSRSDADAARTRLTGAGLGITDVQVLDQSSQGFNAQGHSSDASSSSGSSGTGFWSGVKDFFMADEDRYSYEEGVRRGGAVLVAKVEENRVDDAVRMLEETGTVDMDEREQSWKQSGYQGYDREKMGSYYGRDQQSTGMSSNSMGQSAMSQGTASTGTTGNEQSIPIMEEQLTVGKREVNRGTARVRAYTVEEPVNEQVTLREEHVNIERRPVTGEYAGAAGGTGDRSALFQEREIEVTETAEEAVVAKEARVKEELVVSKTAEQRTETISDTVRHTEVDVDRGTGGTTSTTGTGGSSGTSGMGSGGMGSSSTDTTRNNS